MFISLRFFISISLLFCISVNAVFAQDEPQEIIRFKDFLTNELDSIKKVGLYNDLAWEYSLSNYDSSLKYTNKAIRLSNIIDR